MRYEDLTSTPTEYVCAFRPAKGRDWPKWLVEAVDSNDVTLEQKGTGFLVWVLGQHGYEVAGRNHTLVRYDDGEIHSVPNATFDREFQRVEGDHDSPT